MVVDEDVIQEIREMCSGAAPMEEGGHSFIHFPQLKLPDGSVVEALLCLREYAGYMTRLFLSQPVVGKGTNWTVHRILDKTWHTWSWQNVSPDQRPLQILADHLRALR